MMMKKVEHIWWGFKRSNIQSFGGVHVVLGSHMRPCKPSALDLTIADTWVRLQQSSQGGSL